MAHLNTGWNDCPPVQTHPPQPEISVAQVQELLEELVGRPSGLLPREYAHYTKKLRAAGAKALEHGAHRALIGAVVGGFLANGDKETAKTTIAKYALANPGVTSWSVPLRKVVEGVE